MQSNPRPTNIVLHKQSRALEVSFDNGEQFHLPCEFLRVYSPSAEVRGHGPGQEVLQTGKELVNINEVEGVGAEALRHGHVGVAADGAVQRLGKLALVGHLHGPRERVLVALHGALEDGGDRLDGRRRALRHARRAQLVLAVHVPRVQRRAALLLGGVGVFQEERTEKRRLAIEAPVGAGHFGQLVGASPSNLCLSFTAG